MQIRTPRGTFTIAAEFKTAEEARKTGFGFYFENDDGRGIWTKSAGDHCCQFATGPAVSVML